MHFYERLDVPTMFDLASDPGEASNIAKQQPEKHKQLFDQMLSYLKEVDARFPKPTPQLWTQYPEEII